MRQKFEIKHGAMKMIRKISYKKIETEKPHHEIRIEKLKAEGIAINLRKLFH